MDRADAPVRLAFQPGFFSEAADVDAVNRWKDGNRVRFKNGLPEKFGGWEEEELTGAPMYGVDRREHEWTSLDGQPWVAIGTSRKLYVVNRGVRYDITPIRRSTTLSDPFTTTDGDATVLVTDVLHGAQTGDFVRFTGASAVGGLTLEGEYEITVINGTQYTIEAGSPANADATGGGAVAAEYDINTGNADAAQAHGWGTCTYGTGTWGTRRGDCSAIILPPRIWSLDNFGEDLLASPRGGALYWWDRSLGPTSRAVLIETAPQTIEVMLVSPSGDQIIALGAFDNVAGSPDKMLVRTSDTGSIVDWEEPLDLDEENNVFSERLSNGSRIISGTKTRRGVRVCTDKQSYMMLPDATEVWDIEPIAQQNPPAGPNAEIDVNGVTYSMTADGFIKFDGVQDDLPCDVWGYIFDQEDDTPGLNLGQLDKIYAYYNSQFDEVMWLYPSRDSIENDRYVCFQIGSRIWYYGSIARTAMSTGGIAYSGPYGSAPDGTFYRHEVGVDADGAAMNEYIESFDMRIADGAVATHLNLFIPNFKRWTGVMRMILKTKNSPQDAAPVRTKTYDMPDTTKAQGIRAAGRQLAVRFGTTTVGTSWRMGVGQFTGQPDAERGSG